MTCTGPTLIDILEPPRNPWLRQLLSGKRQPLAGVRVVRFGERDDIDEPETGRGGSAGQAQLAEA